LSDSASEAKIAEAPRHRIPLRDFDLLAAGGGDQETIHLLSAGERSRRLILLKVLLDRMTKVVDPWGPLPGTDAAWQSLIAIQECAPEEFERILLLPQTGMWIAHCLRRMRVMDAGHVPLWVDIGHVFSLVLAVAARVSLELTVAVPHREGRVMIPALGMARVHDAPAFGLAVARVYGGRLRLRVGRQVVEVRLPDAADTLNWWSMRTLRSPGADRELVVQLDDIDPYRTLRPTDPPERLRDAEVGHWQQLLDEAYAIIERDSPLQAAALADFLQVLVPVPAALKAEIRSGTSGDSVGGVLVSRPHDPVAFAAMLVHEFQHVKLESLMHLLALCQDDGSLRYYAPWRDDPRPLTGLFQGVYAFLGVTQFWRLRWLAGGPALGEFEFDFAFRRAQTWHGLRELRRDPRLTELGQRFVTGMVTQLRPWCQDRVTPLTSAAARLAITDHRVGWRIRHTRPAPADIAELVGTYRAGLVAPAVLPFAPVVPGLLAGWSHRRLALARLRVTAPDEFAARPPSADRDLVAGNYPGAASGYVDLLASDPGDQDAWTGLVLAISASNTAHRPLLRRPELLPAVYRQLRIDRRAPDPRILARWLCGRPVSARFGALQRQGSDVRLHTEAFDRDNGCRMTVTEHPTKPRDSIGSQ
jgi:HEXXH motif-containing protein